jgi:hypothetical protein
MACTITRTETGGEPVRTDLRLEPLRGERVYGTEKRPSGSPERTWTAQSFASLDRRLMLAMDEQLGDGEPFLAPDSPSMPESIG